MESGVLANVVTALLTLVFVNVALRAIRTGEVRAKRSVIRRSEYPVVFYLFGLNLMVAAVGLDFAFGLGLMMKLINLKL